MIRIANDVYPDRLTDDRLLTLARDVLAAASARRALRAPLRHLLASQLTEIKIEMLAASELSPEAILALAEVDHGTSAPLAPMTPPASGSGPRAVGAAVARGEAP